MSLMMPVRGGPTAVKATVKGMEKPRIAPKCA
jgi:hypothetical protein